MDPLTHFLTGAAMGRAGFNRKTAYATLAMTLAAEAADLDVFSGFGGPVAELQHHRGVMHSLIFTPVWAGLTCAVVWAGVRMVEARRKKRGAVTNTELMGGAGSGPTAGKRVLPTLRWGWLFACAWLAALSHLLLDWTNAYGLRPFLPFSAKWYEGDLVFIVEPIFWGVLILAVIGPWVTKLVDREIGAKKVLYRGTWWARVALAVMVVTWGVRWVEHERAMAMVALATPPGVTVTKVGLGPYPITPFHWHAVMDEPDRFETRTVNSATGNVLPTAGMSTYYKQPNTAAMRAAMGSYLGRVYMDWAEFAWVTEEQPVADATRVEYVPLTPVNFEDLRFAYHVLGERGRSVPLTGQVLIGQGNTVVEMKMGTRVQK
jgi:inner membrane protein